MADPKHPCSDERVVELVTLLIEQQEKHEDLVRRLQSSEDAVKRLSAEVEHLKTLLVARQIRSAYSN